MNTPSDMLQAFRRLYRGYVSTLETGRDRLQDFGCECDPVDRMEESDPHLREARVVIAALEALGNDWQLVPKTPTGPMLEASWQYTRKVPTQIRIELDHASPARRHHIKMTGRWGAMLDAAPNPAAAKTTPPADPARHHIVLTEQPDGAYRLHAGAMDRHQAHSLAATIAADLLPPAAFGHRILIGRMEPVRIFADGKLVDGPPLEIAAP